MTEDFDIHVNKALETQKKIIEKVINLPKENMVLFLCAAYNAEIAILYKKIDDLKTGNNGQ